MNLLSAKFSFTFYVFINNFILAGIHFIFLKKGPRPNLISFQYQIWISMKRSEK